MAMRRWNTYNFRMQNGQPTLLGAPYDASSSFLRGAAGAPPKIRAALRSDSANGFSESGIDVLADGVLGDDGDLTLGEGPDARAAIEAGVRAIAERDGRPIVLGGDHSITYSVMRALGSMYPDLTIVQFDAHPDLYDHYEGDRHSHACQFARIMEEGLASRLVQVGIRTITAHQREQARRFGVDVIDMKTWASGRKPSVGSPTYISLDLDGLDPAFAPGVSHPEPGGLSVRDVLAVIQSLPGPIVGADIVELNPTRDVNDLTAFVAAKFVKEIAGAMIETRMGAT
jgi:agmatinase